LSCPGDPGSKKSRVPATGPKNEKRIERGREGVQNVETIKRCLGVAASSPAKAAQRREGKGGKRRRLLNRRL